MSRPGGRDGESGRDGRRNDEGRDDVSTDGGGHDVATDGGRRGGAAVGRGRTGRGRGGGISFSARELRDLAAAWLALGVAFTFFLNPGYSRAIQRGGFSPDDLAANFALSLLTVGVGFLLHELAHKVVAVRFGQVAAFRADYGMLFLAVMAGLIGFFFAAPGAVVHRGHITERENGIIAVAGPITNLLLVVAFLPLALVEGFAGRVGSMGVIINLLLAGFNMIPYGPLDGKKVLGWNKLVYVVVAAPSILLAVALFVV